MSDCAVAALPMACSGDRYWAVPMTMPESVIGMRPVAVEMPKSVIFTRPERDRMMLPGFTSRCTTPATCAA
ncbi:hypothetical protein N867_09705, partial [Actinotalea fermentans ATCC 43279 = JCM 9966 = DSM 3133]